jgi:hypothetical protein
VPILSLTLLAFAPFLWLALIRRQARDWAVFAAYFAAVVAELVLLSIGKPGGTVSAIGAVMLLLVAGTATVHTLVAFRPAAGLPSWRDVHTLRAADKRQKLANGTARQREFHERATAARADQKNAHKADRAAARAPKAEAKQVRTAERATARAARAEAKQAHTAERDAARAPKAEAKQVRRAERAAARVARAEAKQERKREEAARKAARQAENLAAPRYGWVETRRTYRSKTIFGNRRSETIVSQPSQRNARRRTRQSFGVTITEEWRRLN